MRSGATRTRVPLHFAGSGSDLFRTLLQAATLWPVVRWFCHPLSVEGARTLPRGPVVFVANHSSHADTAVILKALPFRLRRRTRPAAAEDHFWRSEALGASVSLLTGAFPFPRRGCEGIDRAQALLDRGHSVLLFPEGTRSCDGSIAEFHKGAGILAARGATVVPVGVAGTEKVLPKAATRPRSAPVSVVFGGALRTQGDPEEIVASLRSEVTQLRDDARRRAQRGPGRTYARVAALAHSKVALAAMFVWAFCEALAWPVIPDFLLLPLVVLAPRRVAALFLAALAGSLAGGLVSYAVGPTGIGVALLDNVPLVTDEMVRVAGARLDSGGAPALLTQPLSGIPYKAFSYQSADAGVGLGGFVAFSAVARGTRFLAIAFAGALAGRFLRPVWERFGAYVLPLYAGGFGVGLFRVVQAWS